MSDTKQYTLTLTVAQASALEQLFDDVEPLEEQLDAEGGNDDLFEELGYIGEHIADIVYDAHKEGRLTLVERDLESQLQLMYDNNLNMAIASFNEHQDVDAVSDQLMFINNLTYIAKFLSLSFNTRDEEEAQLATFVEENF